MSVVVVTDTTASVDPELAAEWGIRLVPLTVTVAGRSYRDGEIDVSSLVGATATTADHRRVTSSPRCTTLPRVQCS